MRAFYAVLLLILSSLQLAQAGPNLRDEEYVSSLRGIRSVALWTVGFDENTQAVGLSESDVRSAVQPTLEQLGIRLLSKEEVLKNPSIPVFTAHVNVLRNNVDSSYSFSLEFRQVVRPVSNPKLAIHVPTWSLASQGMANNRIVAPHILSYLREGMLAFLQDYQRANSKP